jgi:copper(I)-binding protein
MPRAVEILRNPCPNAPSDFFGEIAPVHGLNLVRACVVTVLVFAGGAMAQSQSQSVTVGAPWVRGTVAGQKATGAFMELTSSSEVTLVSAASPAAGIVEVHEMKMDDGVMRMRAVSRLALPAGVTVQLKPGSYHVMLMDLKQPLKKGNTVALTLRFEHHDKKVETLEVQAEVRDLTAPSSSAPAPVR